MAAGYYRLLGVIMGDGTVGGEQLATMEILGSFSQAESALAKLKAEKQPEIDVLEEGIAVSQLALNGITSEIQTRQEAVRNLSRDLVNHALKGDKDIDPKLAASILHTYEKRGVNNISHRALLEGQQKLDQVERRLNSPDTIFLQLNPNEVVLSITAGQSTELRRSEKYKGEPRYNLLVSVERYGRISRQYEGDRVELSAESDEILVIEASQAIWAYTDGDELPSAKVLSEVSTVIIGEELVKGHVTSCLEQVGNRQKSEVLFRFWAAAQHLGLADRLLPGGYKEYLDEWKLQCLQDVRGQLLHLLLYGSPFSASKYSLTEVVPLFEFSEKEVAAIVENTLTDYANSSSVIDQPNGRKTALIKRARKWTPVFLETDCGLQPPTAK